MRKFFMSAAQGEVHIRRVDSLPDGLSPVEPESGMLIVGHSESGHHHGFFADKGGVQLMERTSDVPQGMKILYAIVKNPSELIQDAPGAHEGILHEPGLYEFRISREYNAFEKQARQVAD
jgi:hypothetical protein